MNGQYFCFIYISGSENWIKNGPFETAKEAFVYAVKNSYGGDIMVVKNLEIEVKE